jgi:hypothetical protein
MARARHHTVSAFLLERFARDTDRGRRVCMLAKASGQPTQVSPRDATVQKHFYSLDTEEGRDPIVEHILGVVESKAAPLLARLDEGEVPWGSDRLGLALFIAMCRLRTPTWREETASVVEQLATTMFAESLRLDPGITQRALADSDAEPDQIEELRAMLVEDMETGEAVVRMPKNAMIKYFLDGSSGMSWILFMFDWTVVQLAEVLGELVIADNPVSLYDPAPVMPGGGVGVLSSPETEIFLPIGPRRGLLLTPNEEVWNWWRSGGAEVLHEVSTDDERWDEVREREGRWAEIPANEKIVLDLNLRSYAHADRYLFGSQRTLQDLRTARRSHRARLAEVTPRGGRMHILEEDPDSEDGLLQITQTFAPQRRQH